MGSWYSSQTPRSFMYPLEGKLLKRLGIMLQVILAHSVKSPGFSYVHSKSRAGLPTVNGWHISQSALSQPVHRQSFNSLPIIRDSQGSRSLVLTDCTSCSSRDKNQNTKFLPQWHPLTTSSWIQFHVSVEKISFASFNFTQFLITLNALLVAVLTAYCSWCWVSPAVVAWHSIYNGSCFLVSWPWKWN